MLEQKDADENGFVGYIDKDHKANLVSICKTCHAIKLRIRIKIQKHLREE